METAFKEYGRLMAEGGFLYDEKDIVHVQREGAELVIIFFDRNEAGTDEQYNVGVVNRDTGAPSPVPEFKGYTIAECLNYIMKERGQLLRVSELEIQHALRKHIQTADDTELARIAGVVLGGECCKVDNWYKFVPNDNYVNCFRFNGSM